jgi:hypothetical protein
VAAPHESPEGEQGFPEVVGIDHSLLPQPRHVNPVHQQAIRIVGQPLQVAQGGGLQFRRDHEIDRLFQTEYRVPPAPEIVSHLIPAGGHEVFLRIE